MAHLALLSVLIAIYSIVKTMITSTFNKIYGIKKKLKSSSLFACLNLCTRYHPSAVYKKYQKVSMILRYAYWIQTDSISGYTYYFGKYFRPFALCEKRESACASYVQEEKEAFDPKIGKYFNFFNCGSFQKVIIGELYVAELRSIFAMNSSFFHFRFYLCLFWIEVANLDLTWLSMKVWNTV